MLFYSHFCIYYKYKLIFINYTRSLSKTKKRDFSTKLTEHPRREASVSSKKFKRAPANMSIASDELVEISQWDENYRKNYFKAENTDIFISKDGQRKSSIICFEHQTATQATTHFAYWVRELSCTGSMPSKRLQQNFLSRYDTKNITSPAQQLFNSKSIKDSLFRHKYGQNDASPPTYKVKEEANVKPTRKANVIPTRNIISLLSGSDDDDNDEDYKMKDKTTSNRNITNSQQNQLNLDSNIDEISIFGDDVDDNDDKQQSKSPSITVSSCNADVMRVFIKSVLKNVTKMQEFSEASKHVSSTNMDIFCFIEVICMLTY